ncbi:MAG: class II aldolase/adducin family protein [Chloroflexi bacterium]|nr:class II aldolase/adducin family protein [Chloroflexota bacterium]
MNGWTGKILEIDLTAATIKSHALDMDMARRFLGGRGLGARLLWDAVGPNVEPLSPDNVLIFATGPLTATGYQTSNRFSVANALAAYKIVVLRGHGSFAIGQTLDEAFHWTSTLEEACEIALKAKLIDEPFIEYRKMSEGYAKW